MKKNWKLIVTLSVSSLTMLMGPAASSLQAQAAMKNQVVQAPVAPSIKAESAIVIDAYNGQVLYQKNPDARRAPASTTKLMTMLLVMEALNKHQISWTDEVPITPDAQKVAVEQGVSNAYLDPREHFTLEEMMKFIAVLSANDATVAVADKIGGDKQSFVDMMNAEAQKIGLTGTHYMNPDGLPQDNHYTTARDLAKLADYIVTHYPQLLQFTSMPKVTVRKGNTWPNTDKLIGHYPGVDGLKTGYTADAGYCYVGTASKNGRRIISVVMGDTTTDENQRFRDTATLFDYGFDEFSQAQPYKAGQALPQTLSVSNGRTTHLQLVAKNGLSVDLPVGVHGQVVVHAQPAMAPIVKGAQVGTVDYEVNGQTVVSSPVVAAEDDPQANWFVRMMRGIGSWFSHLLHRGK